MRPDPTLTLLAILNAGFAEKPPVTIEAARRFIRSARIPSPYVPPSETDGAFHTVSVFGCGAFGIAVRSSVSTN